MGKESPFGIARDQLSRTHLIVAKRTTHTTIKSKGNVKAK
jgi:hypothetical protein